MQQSDGPAGRAIEASRRKSTNIVGTAPGLAKGPAAGEEARVFINFRAAGQRNQGEVVALLDLLPGGGRTML